MKFLSGFLVLFILAAPFVAGAADLNFKGDNTLQSLVPEHQPPPPKTREDFANRYYQNCAKDDQNEDMARIMDAQCACTAAQMMELMTFEEMNQLSEATAEGRTQRARLIALAYIPCLKDSLGAVALGNCLEDSKTRASMRHPVKVCECIRDGIEGYIDEKGEFLLPAENRRPFGTAPEDLLENPLGHALNSSPFQTRHRYYTANCIGRFEWPQ